MSCEMNNDNTFLSSFYKYKYILTEGAIVERLKKEYNVKLDEEIMHAGLIYNDRQASVLRNIYMEYIETSEKYDLPIMIMTPTRRANKTKISNSSYNNKNIIKDNVDFLKDIREKYPSHKNKIFIGGLMGCKGDAYNYEEALSKEEGYRFHLWQAKEFESSKVDYLFAGIMPEIFEAIGMAKAMECTNIPYIISFMIRRNGALLDGTIINHAISAIDLATDRKPLGYMVNCVHPSILSEALWSDVNRTNLVKERFLGIQANASPLEPEELDNLETIKSDSPIDLALSIEELHNKHKIKVIGGCCGTDNRHVEEFARKIKKWM
ncbi:homocysteine S-methyltransferase family protein [Clostridium sp. 'White wine YQ']|uniref:homocysteine S-methyltransferase family protein n=1 Tax=Clostridium sp. 'White wine YQ' TaxID=3027474 RepID=UPI0023650603|nr:homocysteine S-methyltransferase family protein [Clostridium sp. 'White wine YQ']MDD7793908.1 homocysteine S-methyltransferase family protein [Clostridium sp. 'White wine YQ']